ncbi:MAG TPA: site-2 protease family protein [Bryobacteraceae bacterium]|nr:site-2 protease family protein [Bryobacteraceae bacterium]
MTRAARDQIYQRALHPTRSPKTARTSTAITFTLTLSLVIGFVLLPLLRPAWLPALHTVPTGGTKANSALAAAFIAAIALHEFGHLTAAIAVKFEILGIALGPFRFARLYGESTVSFRVKSLLGGSISAVPLNERNWRPRILAVIAAGPIATFLTAAIALAVVSRLQPASWASHFFAVLAELSLLIFLLGLIPNGQYTRIRNDAQLFWSVLGNSTEAHAIRLYHRLMRVYIDGMRPRDYPPELVEEMSGYQGRPDLSLAFAAALTKWATDCGDFAMANAWQQNAVRLLPASGSSQRNFASAEWACFALLFTDDLACARRVFSEVRPQEIAPSWRHHRILAAKYVAEGNAAAACREIENALLCLPRKIPSSQFERDLLHRLAARLT